MVELGAGTGVASIALASLRGTLSGDNEIAADTILTTDLGAYTPSSSLCVDAKDLPESAMPLLNENITKNARLASRGAPQALVLDWDATILPKPVLTAQQNKLDLILYAGSLYLLTPPDGP